MILYYENHNGEKIALDSWPVVIEDLTTLFESEWDYDISENKSKNKSEISCFYRAKAQKKITLQVFADSDEEYCEIMEQLNDIPEKDIIERTPGKLWCNDYYLECYMVSSKTKNYEDVFCSVDVEKTLIAINPFWVNGHIYTFYSYKAVTSNDNKRYPGRYPYRYANGLSGEYIINPFFTSANFKLTIYGPVVKPQVTIGNNTYRVNITLEEKERLEIDTREKTIEKVKAFGERVNAFHNRQKGMDFFRKIPAGRQYIMWTGKFEFDVTLYEERSEPRWKM